MARKIEFKKSIFIENTKGEKADLLITMDKDVYKDAEGRSSLREWLTEIDINYADDDEDAQQQAGDMKKSQVPPAPRGRRTGWTARTRRRRRTAATRPRRPPTRGTAAGSRLCRCASGTFPTRTSPSGRRSARADLAQVSGSRVARVRTSPSVCDPMAKIYS